LFHPQHCINGSLLIDHPFYSSLQIQNIAKIHWCNAVGCICSPEMLAYHLNLTALLSSGNIGKRIGSPDGQSSGRGLNVQRFFLNCAYFHPVYEIRDVQATLLSLSCRRNVVYWKVGNYLKSYFIFDWSKIWTFRWIKYRWNTILMHQFWS
jgi:hypothetical protein